MTRDEMIERASAWARKAGVSLRFGRKREDGGLVIAGNGESAFFSPCDDDADFEAELGYWFGNRTLGGTKCK